MKKGSVLINLASSFIINFSKKKKYRLLLIERFLVCDVTEN